MYIYYNILLVSEQYCRFEMLNKSGVIRNPDMDLDGAYDFNTDCIWSIKVHPKNRIEYQFLYLSLRSSFVTDEDSHITHCEGDYITVGWTAYIILACPCNIDPQTPHIYLEKLGFTGVSSCFPINMT